MPAARTRSVRARRAGIAVAVAFAALVPSARAQDRSAVDAQLVGVVVGADGAPVAGVPMHVDATDSGLTEGALIGVLTLGLGCLFGLCTSGEANVDHTITAGDGSYAMTLPHTYVAGKETDTDWVATAQLPEAEDRVSPAVSAYELEVNIGVQEAPPLPLWTVDPIVSVDGWAVTIDVEGRVPPGLEAARVELRNTERGLSRAVGRTTYDARLLETQSIDARSGLIAQATADADIRVPHANGRTIYHQRTQSAVFSVPIVPIPFSRGAGCTGHHANGDEATVALESGCTLTDGDLTTPLSSRLEVAAVREAQDAAEATGTTADPSTTTLAPPPPPLPAETTVDLGSVIDVSLVVLRGASAGTAVEVSTDGWTWTPIPAVGDAAEASRTNVTLVAPELPIPGRYVRALRGDGLDLGELSVWTPRPVDLPDRTGAGDVPTEETPGSSSSRSGRSADELALGELWRLVAIWVALAAVVLMWIAIGYVVVPGSIDRRKLRPSELGSLVRWIRARLALVGCAIGAWPHLLDVVRRVEQHAPPPSPSSLVALSGPARLHRFVGPPGDAPRPPVLVVHSAISGSSVLDLTPQASLVQALLASGRDVWLVDWDFRVSPADLGLEHLAAEVAWASQSIRSLTGAARVPVIAYCLGATAALLREATWPSGDPLVVVAPVVDTSADLATGTGMGVVLGHPWLHPTLALDERGFVPGPVIREAFHWLRPKALKTVRSWPAAKADPELAAGYAAMAAWVWDHQPLPGGVLFDVVALFRRGGLAHRTELGAVVAPVLIVCATRDHIVPPTSSTALLDLVAGPVEVVEIDAGHVGMLVSLGSGDVLRPALLAWLDRHTP